MGPKAKPKKKKAEEPKADEDAELDHMEIEELRETVVMYKNQLRDITVKRNFLQLETVCHSCYSLVAEYLHDRRTRLHSIMTSPNAKSKRST